MGRAFSSKLQPHESNKFPGSSGTTMAALQMSLNFPYENVSSLKCLKISVVIHFHFSKTLIPAAVSTLTSTLIWLRVCGGEVTDHLSPS